VFVFFNDNRSYYGDILAVTNERNKNINHVKNNADGGKEGHFVHQKPPPWAATASNSTKRDAEVIDIR
jgi:hypothetical protein